MCIITTIMCTIKYINELVNQPIILDDYAIFCKMYCALSR